PRAQRGAPRLAWARRTRGRRPNGRLRGLRVGRRRRAVRAVQAGGVRATGRDAGRVQAGSRRQGSGFYPRAPPGGGAPRPEGGTNPDVVRAALATGLAAHDISALAEYLRDLEPTS